VPFRVKEGLKEILEVVGNKDHLVFPFKNGKLKISSSRIL
jgi:hypothetical protein